MTGCNVIEATPEESGKDCGGEGHAGIMQRAGEAEQQSAQQGTAAQIFFGKNLSRLHNHCLGLKVFRRLLGQDTRFDKVIASAYDMAIVGLLLI